MLQFNSKGQPFSRKLMRVKMPGSGVCRHEVWPGTVTAFLQIWLHLSDASLIQIFVGPSFIMVIVISPGSKCTQLIVLIDDCGHRQILIHQSLLGMIKLDWNVQCTIKIGISFILVEASKHENIGNISHFLKVEHQSLFLVCTFIWLQAGTHSTPCWRQWRQDAAAAGGDLPAAAAPRSPGLLWSHFK